MTSIVNYKYEANAAFAIEELKQLGIDAYYISKEKNTVAKSFEVFVENENLIRARHVLNNLALDESELDKNSEQYLAAFSEYADHLYTKDFADYNYNIYSYSKSTTFFAIILLFGLIIFLTISILANLS